MKNFDNIDEQTLGAFVDGQLDAAQSSFVIRAMDKDPDLREHVYQLRRIKDLMKLGFQNARTGAHDQRSSARKRIAFGVAASLTVLSLGFSGGILGYYCAQQLQSGAPLAAAAQPQSDHVVLHIGDANPKHFVAALNYVDQFLRENAANGGQIEVVANAGGLNLMRADLSPLAKEVIAMVSQYDNVRFIACANAIRNLQQRGIEPHIFENIETDKTALDHIVKRLQSGWTYIEVESLPGA